MCFAIAMLERENILSISYIYRNGRTLRFLALITCSCSCLLFFPWLLILTWKSKRKQIPLCITCHVLVQIKCITCHFSLIGAIDVIVEHKVGEILRKWYWEAHVVCLYGH